MLAGGLSQEEKTALLQLAREAMECAVRRRRLPPLNPKQLSPTLQADGASFVTLTIDGQLRGCIGALEAYQPLVEDVREHAAAAATQDYRFPPVSPEELNSIEIEVSYLTPMRQLNYETPQELVSTLRPGTDGVVLRDGAMRATFLPQVWEKIPDPEDFLDQLCLKMGAPRSLWRRKKIEVFTYQVEEFKEDDQK